MLTARTVPAAPTAAGALAGRVLELHDELERLAAGPGGLSPSGPVDAAFSELVGLCAAVPDAVTGAVLADPRVAAVRHRLRQLCAEGEYLLEAHWAGRIAAAGRPPAELDRFPYLANYRDLTALELHTVAGLRPGRLRVCVLGSGPLPLTALLVARALGSAVDAVDLDARATRLAADVLRRLPDGHLVRTHRADARTFAGVARADVVLLAALVGLDTDAKRAVVAAVADRMRPGAVLAVRSAHRLRALLYPPVAPEDLAAAGTLRPLVEVHPLTDVVNSVVVAVRT